MNFVRACILVALTAMPMTANCERNASHYECSPGYDVLKTTCDLQSETCECSPLAPLGPESPAWCYCKSRCNVDCSREGNVCSCFLQLSAAELLEGNVAHITEEQETCECVAELGTDSGSKPADEEPSDSSI